MISEQNITLTNTYNAGWSYKIDVVSPDECFADRTSRIDLIKIDVEGHEIPVLRGARKLLAEDRPVVVIEYNPHVRMANAAPADFLADAMHILGPLGRIEPASGQAFELPAPPLAAAHALRELAESDFVVFDLVTLREGLDIIPLTA